jgi:nitric oxide dioxygenase
MPISLHPLFRDDYSDRMASFRSDNALISRLQTSFAEVLTHGDQLAEAFYRRLFSRRPDVRPMFKADAAVQRRKLMESLATIVGFLDDQHNLDAYLAELGSRHVGFGVKADHYDDFVNALAGAFGDVLGPEMDPELAADWRDTLGLISERMMGA